MRLLKLENEHLKDDNCFLSTLINVSENIFIEKNLMILERHDDIVSIQLDNIFLKNCIVCPTLNPDTDKQYFAESCDDLKPLIKTLSWKDTRFLISEEHQVRNVIREMFRDMQSDITLSAYINDTNNIINFWYPQKWGIKFQDEEKGFGVYKSNIVFFNVEQFNDQNMKKEVKKLMNLMKDEVHE